jgi:transposase InsO family protein
VTDGRCKFGPRAKREMVTRLLAGEEARAIARALGCSPTTVTTTRDRWLEASAAERESGAWCAPRRPVPGSCPWRLDPESERKILEARKRTNWGEMRLQFLCGRHRSTIGRVLRRNGCSRQRRSEPRQTTRRYEWSQPGALLHIDGFELPKFSVPGHWATGERAEQHKTRRAGKTVVIGVVDDHTRLAYCELHAKENAHSVSRTLRRAAAWFAEQGCGPVQAVMSDNAKCYAASFTFSDALAELGARQILIPPYTPRWNGKVERFFGTLDREWAHGRVWPDSTTRDRALPSFLRYYNRRRPHSAAGGRPPITRVHQLREQDT